MSRSVSQARAARRSASAPAPAIVRRSSSSGAEGTPANVLPIGKAIPRGAVQIQGSTLAGPASAARDMTSAWQRGVLEDAETYYNLYAKHWAIRAIIDKTAQAVAADDFTVVKANGDEPEDDEDGNPTVDPRAEAIKTLLLGLFGARTFDQAVRAIAVDLMVNANTYWRVQRSPTPINGVADVAVALNRLDYRSTCPHYSDAGVMDSFSRFTAGRWDYAAERISLADVVMLSDGEQRDGGIGLSKLEALDDTLSIDMDARKVNRGYMRNGTKSGDVYAFDPTGMNPTSIERERDYMIDNFSRPEDSYKPMVMAVAPKDMAIIKKGSDGHVKDMDFEKLLERDTEEAASVYHHPLSLLSLNISTGLGANVKETDTSNWNNDVVFPLQKLVYDDLTRQVLKGLYGIEDYVIEPPHNASVKLEDVQKADTMTGNGATGNEARMVMGLRKKQGLDRPLYIKGRTPVVGAPGDPDCVIYTSTGAVSGDIKDAELMAARNSTLGASLPAPTTPGAAGAPSPGVRGRAGSGRVPGGSGGPTTGGKPGAPSGGAAGGRASRNAGGVVRKAEEEEEGAEVSAQPSAEAVSAIEDAYTAFFAEYDAGLWATLDAAPGGAGESSHAD